MASQSQTQLVSSFLLPVLKYSGHFNFPLLTKEVWYWQINSQFSLSQVRSGLKLLVSQNHIQSSGGYYSSKQIGELISARQHNSGSSKNKWKKIILQSSIFKKIPFIQAVFVTGALSVNNATLLDDIDIMVITSPHTLWLTRAILVLLLKTLHLRRRPGLTDHASVEVSDKICDNLWLDTCHLKQMDQSLYVAHELLQAKPLIDKFGVHHLLLKHNSWVKSFLPVAYSSILKNCSESQPHTSSPWLIILSPFNFLFWLVQRFHMSFRITSEKIGYGYAYFHPRSFKDL